LAEILGLVVILMLCWSWNRYANAIEAKAEERTYTKDEVFEMLDQAQVNIRDRSKEALTREEP